MITVKVTPVITDSVNIRALLVQDEGIYYAGHKGNYGFIPYVLKDSLLLGTPEYYKLANDTLAFRAIAANKSHLYLMNIGSPAKVYRIDKVTKVTNVVYEENDSKVFYDSMEFWNDDEGIAMGDPVDGCMSVIVTRDAGKSWSKVSCEDLPEIIDGEAAFAASDTNIAIVNDHTWMLSGGQVSRVYYSKNKAHTWKVYDTPLIQGKTTTGGYSIDFYDENTGFIIGGDYTDPDNQKKNKAKTSDGGKTWILAAHNQPPNFKSCVQYVPGTKGNMLVTVGFTGFSISQDGGNTWRTINDTSFYTLRFINHTYAIAAGKNKISLLSFERSK